MCRTYGNKTLLVYSGVERLICAHGSKRNDENARSKNSFNTVECRLLEALRWLVERASDGKF